MHWNSQDFSLTPLFLNMPKINGPNTLPKSPPYRCISGSDWALMTLPSVEKILFRFLSNLHQLFCQIWRTYELTYSHQQNRQKNSLSLNHVDVQKISNNWVTEEIKFNGEPINWIVENFWLVSCSVKKNQHNFSRQSKITLCCFTPSTRRMVGQGFSNSCWWYLKTAGMPVTFEKNRMIGSFKKSLKLLKFSIFLSHCSQNQNTFVQPGIYLLDRNTEFDGSVRTIALVMCKKLSRTT